MLPLIFCSLCAQKFWCVRTFLEMTNICNVRATTHVQHYVCATICLCAINLCVCADSESWCARTRAQLRGSTGGQCTGKTVYKLEN